MSLLRWDDTERYEPGFYIGSSAEDGAHIRDASGWPYSVYRKAAQIGVTDMVICNGIQDLEDAKQIKDRIDCLS